MLLNAYSISMVFYGFTFKLFLLFLVYQVVNVVRIGLVSALFCDHDAGFNLFAAARSLVGPTAAARAAARTSATMASTRRAADEEDDDDDDELNEREAHRNRDDRNTQKESNPKSFSSAAAEAAQAAAPHSLCEFEVTVFAFPTLADYWSRALRHLAHHYVQLPAGDWVTARRKVHSTM